MLRAVRCLVAVLFAGGAGLATAPASSAPAPPPLPGPDVAARIDIAAKRDAQTPLSSGGLAAKLEQLIWRAGPASGAWVYDPELPSNRVLFADDAGRSRILASNTKLFTTAAVLDRLGAEATLETRVWADGAVTGGTVQGSLYLVGAGDPALAGREFASSRGLPLTDLADLAGDLRDAGIERVTGRIFVDDTVFDRRRGVGASDFKVSRYIGPLSGLSYNSGLLGTGFAASPEISTGKALSAALEDRGIEVGGGVQRGEAGDALQESEPLAEVSSEPLAELIEETNETSNNFFAEMLLKGLAAATGNQGSTKGGARLVRAFAKRLGARPRIRDGSGLGRGNRASPKGVGTLLAEMLEHSGADPFYESLPRAGVEGTLAGRMEGTSAEGRCRAKTGTLTGVSALSGYCEVGGEPVAFSILMNGVGNLSAARSIQDRMVAAIARYRR